MAALTILQLLEDLIGEPSLARDGLPSFRIDHVYSQRRSAGQAGTGIHGGPKSRGAGSQLFEFRDGRFYNGLLVVAFELVSPPATCCVVACDLWVYFNGLLCEYRRRRPPTA